MESISRRFKSERGLRNFTAREVAFIQYMARHSHFSYKEIAELWDTTVNVVKNIIKKHVYQQPDGTWKLPAKTYTVRKHNPGWKNLIPNAYNVHKRST